MSEKIILGFTGLISCGKGTAAKHFKEKYNAETFRFSTMLRDVLDRLYLKHSRDNMSGISTVLREFFGQDLMAKVMAKDVDSSKSQLIIVDGIRRMDDVKYLRKLPNFKLASIEADMKIRYERLISRSENPDDKTKTWEEFEADHKLETELTILDTMKAADIIINNNSSLEDFKKQLDKLVK
ncbi:AAA family ATPase [bacterium]|jgi:dephospho-CoA kinase|nr:AAA family ATPase [bacterium]MBT4649307.1 AAA family ATPase [bacterium]MBT7553609.1 AAA family ATPase [bacterium]